MDTALKAIMLSWVSAGPLVLVGILIAFGILQNKWGIFILACVVYVAGALILAGDKSGLAGSFFYKISDLYDVKKNTAELLSVLETKSLDAWQKFLLALYCYGKYFVKLVIYNFIILVFGGKPKYWNKFVIVQVLTCMACIAYKLGLDTHALFANEGFISAIILTVIVILKAIFVVVKKPAPGSGRSVGSVVFLLLGWVVASVYVLAIETQVLGKLDDIIFNAALGG